MITDLTKEHPDKILWRFLLPLMISVIFQQFYNIADSMIAGKFAGESALGGGGSILPDYDHLYGLCGGHESGGFGGDFQIVRSRR